MIISITSIELKSPLKFFALSMYALQIVKQLKNSNYVDFKKKGFWTKHYTMTIWNNKEDMVAFATSGAHLKSMKESKKIAKEIRTVSINSETFPNWKEAEKLLKNGKVYKL